MTTVLAAPGSLVAGASVVLEPAEAHHLRVRRAASGEEIRLLDGQGALAQGRLRLGNEAVVEVETVHRMARPASLTLAVGAGDRDRFLWLAEKAAELGVTDLLPLETERTAGVATRLRGDRLERLRNRAREALKQCQTAWAPMVHEPMAITEFVTVPRPGQRWLASAGGEPPPPALDSSPVTVAIGPEGGFTAAETALLEGAGYHPVGLGNGVLRFETAALAAAAIVGSARQRGVRG
ncbi:MAG: RsmE family RNA methyltransferase [Gemmatimonadales bacterium]